MSDDRVKPEVISYWELVFAMGSRSEVENLSVDDYREAQRALRAIRKRAQGK